jgi:hypothetical protein
LFKGYLVGNGTDSHVLAFHIYNLQMIFWLWQRRVGLYIYIYMGHIKWKSLFLYKSKRVFILDQN